MRGVAFAAASLLLLLPALGLDIRSCDEALGMESGAIPDEAITASSSYVPNVGPRNGRLRVEKAGGAWCPKVQVERGVREYLQIDLESVYMVSGVQTQGRYDHGRGQEYAEEYTLEYWRPSIGKWLPYNRWDGKQILSGNSDTATVVTHRLMPAVFATKIRVLPYSVHRRTVCLRVELRGCVDDVSRNCAEGRGDDSNSFSLVTKLGSSSAELLTMTELDYESPRKKYDLRVTAASPPLRSDVHVEVIVTDVNDNAPVFKRLSGGIASYSCPEGSEPLQGLTDSSYDGFRENGYLLGGLGRLTDGEVGADNFRLDIGYGKGNGWIGWRNDSMKDGFVELVFEFDMVRNFSAVHLFTNNFFSRDVQVFAKAKVMFSVGGQFYNGRALSYSYQPDKMEERARNVTIHLQYKLARFIKLRLYFAAKWIMLSEVTFDSVPVGLNMTEELELNSSVEEIIVNPEGDLAWESFETIAARKDGQGFIEVVIGVLTAVMLLLLVVFVIILILSRRQKLQGSPTLLRNPFGVTINMKDLLMNLSSNNANQSNHPTPVSQEPPSDPSSISFEQYRSPLVNAYYTPNYPTLRRSTSLAEESEQPPAVPPLPPSPLTPSPITVDQSPLHYRSLQSTPVVNSKTKTINSNSHFPRVNTDPPNRKRYHTAPRDKQRVPPPVVCWNIAPSMGHAYNCREAELIPIPRYSLQPVETLGSCHAGEISLFETEGLDDIIPNVDKVVIVRKINTDRPNSDANLNAIESLREVRFLASLSDTNICRVLGVCTAEQPPWTVIEYGEMGDLSQYLQFMANKSGTSRHSGSGSFPLSYGCLMFMATQIASGMKYLETKHVVHKDLAARNCLVGRGYVVKITDIAMCRPQYRKDYTEIGGRPPAPIRWLPWESILLDRYTCSSSVWAFAVTLWEVLSFACERPFQHLNNEQVIQNAEHMYYGGELQVLLPKPEICPTEVYTVMCECWKRDESARPTFKQMYLFLTHINKDYIPSD